MWLINYLFSKPQNPPLNNGNLAVHESHQERPEATLPSRFMGNVTVTSATIRSIQYPVFNQSDKHSKYGCTDTDPAICTPFIYQPVAFKNIEEEPKHKTIGTYLCGDCVGILAWDKTSGASLAYHMKDCDDEIIALGLAGFVMATGSNASEKLKESVNILENNRERTSEQKVNAVKNILNTINELNLLGSAQFTLASESEENRPYVRDFLRKAGVKSEQIREFHSFKAILDRKNGSVETDFEFDIESNILRFNKPLTHTVANVEQGNGLRPY